MVQKVQNAFPKWKLDIQFVTVFLNSRQMDVINSCNPNRNLSSKEFTFYLKQLKNFYFICGDFNSHHELWDDRWLSNTTGRNLIQAIIEENCFMLTSKNLPTYYHLQTNSFSTLDLVFVSSHLFSLSEASLEADLGSNHYPVLVKFSIKLQLYGKKRHPKWIFPTNLWVKWQIRLPVLIQTNNVETDNQILADALVKTSKEVFKLEMRRLINRYFLYF